MQHLGFLIGQLDSRVTQLEKDIALLRQEIAGFRGRARRVGVLLILAFLAALTNSGPGGAEMLAAIIKAML